MSCPAKTGDRSSGAVSAPEAGSGARTPYHPASSPSFQYFQCHFSRAVHLAVFNEWLIPKSLRDLGQVVSFSSRVELQLRSIRVAARPLFYKTEKTTYGLTHLTNPDKPTARTPNSQPTAAPVSRKIPMLESIFTNLSN